MDYRKFVKEVLRELKEKHGEGLKIEASRIKKTNCTDYDGVIFQKGDDENVSLSPILRLEPLYEAYIKGEMDVSGCAQALWKDYEGHRETEELREKVKDIRCWDAVRGKVYPMLLPAKWNQEMLPHLVSVPLLDLAVVFIIRGEMADGGYSAIKVTKSMLEGYQISSCQLYEAAMENLENDGYCFQNMEALLKDMPKMEGAGFKEPDIPEKKEMYVLTNTPQIYGAAGIMNKKLVKEFTGGRDFYILPSSLHETIFVQASDGDSTEKMNRMVAEVNELEVAKEEWLSDHCYYYDGKADEIRMEP